MRYYLDSALSSTTLSETLVSPAADCRSISARVRCVPQAARFRRISMSRTFRRGDRCVAHPHPFSAAGVRCQRGNRTRIAWMLYANHCGGRGEPSGIARILCGNRDVHRRVYWMRYGLRHAVRTVCPRGTRPDIGGLCASPVHLHSPTHRRSTVRLRDVVATDLRRREIRFYRALKNVSVCLPASCCF